MDWNREVENLIVNFIIEKTLNSQQKGVFHIHGIFLEIVIVLFFIVKRKVQEQLNLSLQLINFTMIENLSLTNLDRLEINSYVYYISEQVVEVSFISKLDPIKVIVVIVEMDLANDLDYFFDGTCSIVTNR